MRTVYISAIYTYYVILLCSAIRWYVLIVCRWVRRVHAIYVGFFERFKVGGVGSEIASYMR